MEGVGGGEPRGLPPGVCRRGQGVVDPVIPHETLWLCCVSHPPTHPPTLTRPQPKENAFCAVWEICRDVD